MTVFVSLNETFFVVYGTITVRSIHQWKSWHGRLLHAGEKRARRLRLASSASSTKTNDLDRVTFSKGALVGPRALLLRQAIVHSSSQERDIHSHGRVE